ncbi:MAG: type IV secretion system DNA-binding domain-containing protein [Patescibacteria group bacterium]|nr:type IV secretion system DNA-binding domain-containing protein [Patescibacteria group bacterium]
MKDDITYFAKTNFRGQEHIFGIKKDDRRRHMYVIGKTGMGKTTLLENMVISDIKAGRGVAVVDPHGDFAEKVLNFVPPSRINDVIYFNPADIDYPIAFNVMEQVDPKYKHLVASGLIGVFKKIWADSWGPRLEYLLRNVILGLLEYPGSTLLGVPRMLVDKEYRNKVVAKISDPVVKTFWTSEFTKYSNQFTVEAISPIQNKVGQFLSSSLVRNIISQTNSTIDMKEITDGQKIFIVNLSKGRIGEDYSALLGAMLITKIQLAIMGRVDMPEEERKDFYLYVDEFQNFATESFADILSEARKYRLNLTIAHQYINQLEEIVSDAVFGNVGTIVTFRVGASDAEFLEKEFEPVFMMNDLVNLAKYDVYLKLMIDGISGDAFSATSLAPTVIPEKKENLEKIIKVSRERYARKREVVEEKVSRWSGINDGQEEAPAFQDKTNKTNNYQNSRTENDNREMWDAVCKTCDKKIKVPFKPDPSRDTYCKDCLAEARKESTKRTNSKRDDNEFKAKEKQGVFEEKKEEKITDNNSADKNSVNKIREEDKELIVKQNTAEQKIIKQESVRQEKPSQKKDITGDLITDDLNTAQVKNAVDAKTNSPKRDSSNSKDDEKKIGEGEVIKF